MTGVQTCALPDLDGLSLHFYTVPGSWEHKNKATEFTKDDYWETMAIASRMDQLVTDHAAIMDKYDPDKRVGLIVDEWGTWFEVEPGTNPGFLYQQNTMRDAMVAALTLDIFNKHCDRVYMANIAQTVNVLQAIILTEDGKMVLTPTYSRLTYTSTTWTRRNLVAKLRPRSSERRSSRYPA